MGVPSLVEGVVAEVCLYGTSFTGAGYLARTAAGRMFGTGDPVKERTFSEALWRAQHELRQAGTPDGPVAVFSPDGQRVALVGLNEATYFGALDWKPAPVYEIPVEALLAASQEPS